MKVSVAESSLPQIIGNIAEDMKVGSEVKFAYDLAWEPKKFKTDCREFTSVNYAELPTNIAHR